MTMNNIPFRSRFNWRILDGDETRQISYSVQTAEDIDKCISQDELLNPEACLVLQADDDRSFCEQKLNVYPIYQISKLALIAECSKIESYVGRAQEYNRTYHGELIYDSDSQLYRFDINLNTCKISDLLLRFIVPHSEPLCLYGMHMVLEKGTSPMTLFDNQSTIRHAMNKCRLDDSKLSENAAKCKAFMLASMDKYALTNSQQSQNVFNNNTSSSPDTLDSIEDNNTTKLSSRIEVPMQPHGGNRQDIEASADSSRSTAMPKFPLHSTFSEMLVKQYIDSKFLDFERMIDSKLQAMEFRQNKKLDEIMCILESIARK